MHGRIRRPVGTEAAEPTAHHARTGLACTPALYGFTGEAGNPGPVLSN